MLPREGFLVLGQHRDDQLETLLQRLVRGAGVKGLAVMPETRPWPPVGSGDRCWTSRGARCWPMPKPRADWIEDPSNADTRLDRNYLRHQVLPRLRDRWPGVDQVMARSARHLAEADELLGELASLDLQAARRPNSLSPGSPCAVWPWRPCRP